MANKDTGGGGGGTARNTSAFSGIPSALSGIRSAVSSTARRATAPSRSSSRSAPVRRSSGSSQPRSPQPTVRRQTFARPAVGSTSKGTIAPSVPAPTKSPMTLDQWLAGDTAFQGQKTAYQKALADYAAQDAAERGKYENEYTASLGKLGVEKEQGQQALNDDYASRGLMQSGLYADALNDYQNNFATRQADLERARQAYLADLTTDKSNYTTQQQLELQKAQQAAAARRQATLGL